MSLRTGALWKVVVALAVVPSSLLWLALIDRSEFGGRDALVLLGMLLCWHALLFASLGVAVVLVLLAVHRRPLGAREVSGWVGGAGLGVLLLVNAGLRFPLSYGLLSSQQPFLHPLGLASGLVFVVAPALFGWLLSGRMRRWWWVGVVWLTLFSAAVAANLWMEVAPRANPVTAPVEPLVRESPGERSVAPSSAPVVVLGFDGLAWEVLIPLLERGELPHVAALLNGGARGSLRTLIPTLSPPIWSTIATGQPPHVHGILGFSKFSLPGVRAPLAAGPGLAATGWWNGFDRVLLGARRLGLIRDEPFFRYERRAPALWDLAERHGQSSGVAGWLTTWPVEPAISGSYRISDFSARPASVFPAAELLPVVRQERSLPAEVRHLEGAVAGPQLLDAWHRGENHVFRFATLLKERPTRATFLYLHVIDEIHHRAWRGASRWVVGPTVAYNRSPTAILSSYRLLDRWLGELVAAAGEEALVIVVSDHGFRFDGLQHHRGPDGVLILSGPGVKSGALIEAASVYDVFPTVAAVLGLPLAKDLPGRVLEEAFVRGFVPPQPFGAAREASYGWFQAQPAPEVERSPEVEAEQLERMRSLGYVN